MRPHPCTPGHARLEQRGLTLVELLVALAIGLLLVVAMTAIFVGSSRSRTEVERSAEVIENGRYALDVLSRELSQAGFYGSLVQPTGTTSNAGSAMCARGATNLAAWRDSLPFHVAGLNNSVTSPSCITRKTDSDAIFVQRASTCAVGQTGCDGENNSNAYVQVSECGTQYSTLPVVVERGDSGASFPLQTRTCSTTQLAEKRRLVRRIYYVSTDDVLSYQEVTLEGTLPAPVRLVENIEQLQIEYALDTNGDASPDSFDSAPTDWANVIGARVWVLARSATGSQNTKNETTFTIGDLPTYTVAAASTNLKRRVYSTYIPFVTPKARREN